MKKRGMIEVHFNWIFVLIAGAVIFVFFINIVNKQREFSDIKTSSTIITNLESILTGAQVSTGTVNIVDMPRIDIGFECNRYFIGPAPKQTKGNVIFAPSLLKGKQMITWALDWNMPYRVTNFLFITDPQVRYIIVHDGNTETVANNLKDDELPKEMNKEVISSGSSVTDKNNYKIKFIFLTTPDDNVLTDFNKMSDEDVTAIQLTGIGGSTVIPTTGTIQFFQKDSATDPQTWQSQGTTFYLKKEAFFGAIFAADIEMYNCVMKKAFKKLNLVTTIYLERSTELENYYNIQNSGCADIYASVQISLGNMQEASEDRVGDFPNILDNMEAMWDFAKNIGITDGSANNLAQLYSCALIY